MHPKNDDGQLTTPSTYTGVESSLTIQDPDADQPEGIALPAGVGLLSVPKITPVDFIAALGWYADAHEHRPFDVSGMCQACARKSYEVEALNGSAWIQWLTTSPENKHVTSDFSKVPLGALLITKGPNPAGHIFEARREFKDGTPSGWSNDVLRTGFIDAVSRNAPRDHWGHKNIGWITEINGYALDPTHGVPKPLENQRYKRIERSIEMLREVRDDEKRAHDKREAALVQNEIDRLKTLYSKVKHT